MAAGVKICGLTRPEDVAAAAEAGARYVGFVHFPPSPRHLGIDRIAALAALVPPGIAKVALTVDASDALLAEIAARVPADIVQLHGQEDPARLAEIRTRTGLPVMKALGISTARDLDAIAAYETVADLLLIDAKAPAGSALPGGNGAAFDWTLLAGRHWSRPWMLAGGLTADTVAEAIRVTGAPCVDVSSGVESAPGVKDPAKIAAFAAALQV